MNHEFFMHRCIDLAWKGRGWVVPNPMVGCVIVHDNKIVAEGYHEKYGEPHAEVNAINNLPPDINPINCILYVNLEPCSHFGKTPPCSDLILKKGFKKIVISHADPNPLVAGMGIRRLKENGVEVITGILEKESRHLNRRFIYHHENQKPWITLKWAQTSDGYISRLNPKNREENKITCYKTDVFIHELRSMHDAILVGKNTILVDNPYLNVRFFDGRSPTRIVLGFDKQMIDMNICKSEKDKVTFLSKKCQEIPNSECIEVNTKNAEELMNVFKELNIQSILVEGGKKIHEFFIKHELYQEIICISSKIKNFKNGIPAPDLPLKIFVKEDFEIDNDNIRFLTK